MRLGLTNLAWDPSQDEAVAGLLARLGVDAIDVAPSKYFSDVAAVCEAEVRRVRDWWADRGIEITGMQSLLYGTQGLNLFGPPDVQQRMLAYLAAVCRVGAWLGATRLVFGSPANRNRAGLTDAEAWARALEFFGRLAEVAAEAGVTICLEGVHPHYGANFMTDTASSLRMAQALNHPSVGIVLDTAVVQLNGEDIEALLAEGAAWVRHIHASEKDLVPLGQPAGARQPGVPPGVQSGVQS
ncbi:MAG: sugar phosphate isomerase/epimerase, partial [Lautropia mirabilis]|nr:sugar phosphate isomerase/epimerase [Lautropia mirabilis]